MNVTSAFVLSRFRDGDANVRAVWLFSRNDAIGNLVDQNLLIRTADSGAARYGMLTSIREFGQSQLISTGENLSVRDRFARRRTGRSGVR